MDFLHTFTRQTEGWRAINKTSYLNSVGDDDDDDGGSGGGGGDDVDNDDDKQNLYSSLYSVWKITRRR